MRQRLTSRFVLIPATEALPAVLPLARVHENMAHSTVLELVAQYACGSRLLLRYALKIGGHPSPN
jgi:hypothetical protein